MKCDLPIYREKNPNPCCPRPAGIRLDPCRTLVRPIPDTSGEDVLQDETGFAVLDEATSQFIFDNMKQGNTFA